MKAFPFAIWPGELIKAGPPELNAFHARRRLDPAQSYSVPSATAVIDPERSFQRTKYIPAATLDSMEGYQHAGQKAKNLGGATIRAHPATSVYDHDPREGFLPAGHAHRNADIKGRLHLLASADHDAAFHELSDMHRVIGAMPNPTAEHYGMLFRAEERLQAAEDGLTHSRTGHAGALAEPSMGSADTHHRNTTDGRNPGKDAQDILVGQQGALSSDVAQFPSVSFGLAADSMTGRPAKSASEMAKQLALSGSTPFLAAYQAGSKGFLPQGNLEEALRGARRLGEGYMPKTPEEVQEAYLSLGRRRREHPDKGLQNSASTRPSHVADGTSDWGDYSQNALYGRAFRPQAPEWARQGENSSLGRVSVLRRIMDAASPTYSNNGPGMASITRNSTDFSQKPAPEPTPPQAGTMGSITRNAADIPQEPAPKPKPPQAGLMGGLSRMSAPR